MCDRRVFLYRAYKHDKDSLRYSLLSVQDKNLIRSTNGKGQQKVEPMKLPLTCSMIDDDREL